MQQEHLADRDRQQFNQGMHRSLRNGLLVGLISAIIITAIGTLALGLSFGLADGLSRVLRIAWILPLTGMMVNVDYKWRTHSVAPLCDPRLARPPLSPSLACTSFS
jgi:hypothetical protein